ncbi:MAG: peptide-methionine (R)-S-oxide reductase, partial [Pseudomonadales bacterium]|nr:peptide-methionine (R)-S-oxide reductase [Pseudomonadales bacterium]
MADKLNDLTDEEKQVILVQGHELPFTGKYDDFFETGLYIC